jgi:hypothetical protein
MIGTEYGLPYLQLHDWDRIPAALPAAAITSTAGAPEPYVVAVLLEQVELAMICLKGDTGQKCRLARITFLLHETDYCQLCSAAAQ